MIKFFLYDKQKHKLVFIQDMLQFSLLRLYGARTRRLGGSVFDQTLFCEVGHFWICALYSTEIRMRKSFTSWDSAHWGQLKDHVKQVDALRRQTIFHDSIEFLEAFLHYLCFCQSLLDRRTHNVSCCQHLIEFVLSWLTDIFHNYLAKMVGILGFKQCHFLV